MDIVRSTHDYEAWLGARLTLIPADLELKHQRMAEGAFPFLRATFYRWAQTWPEICADLVATPAVLSVGDLHIENFGTWRDAEGRLVWGINDFDEAYSMPYAVDLVRLATSALLAIDADHLTLDPDDACKAILKGYQESLESGGRPFVLAENYRVLREWATTRLKDPGLFWDKLNNLPPLEGDIPPEIHDILSRALPEAGLNFRIVHRIAGLGSLGRQRYVALAQWRGGSVAREAKSLVPSAWAWNQTPPASDDLFYDTIVAASVRTIDPWVHLGGRWIVRRLSPDCQRIELDSLPDDPNELKLLAMMGRETANVHLGAGSVAKAAILDDLTKRDRKWLRKAAQAMLASVRDDWKQWKKRATTTTTTTMAATSVLH